jgi:hypothetical protein
MHIIEPITITDSILTACNVPENDEQEWNAGTSYNIGDTVMVTTSTANIHKTYEVLVGQTAGISAGLMDVTCVDISSWTSIDSDTGISEVSPASQFRFDTNLRAAGNASSGRYYTIATPPNTHTIEIKTYFDAIGTLAADDGFRLSYGSATWRFDALFCSDGLYIYKTGGASGEVGSDIVKCNASAAWQTWRFQITKTVESAATVEVFLKEEGGGFVSQGVFDCDFETVAADGRIALVQYGYSTDNRVTHIDYIKVGTGLGQFDTTNDSPTDNTNWLAVDSTNRWRAFNGILGSQTSQATKIEYVLTPGEVIDSVALLNLVSDTVDIVEIDSADQLILNNDWTDATGGTPPTNWDEVGTVADFTIQSAALRITCDANGEGISQTITVSAATEYQLLFKYKNTSGDIAQVAIYDMTHSADILATTDLTSSTANASYSKVFTTPAGCTSIKISLQAKTAGDIVWFEAPYLCPTEYSETVTTGASKTDVVKMDIPQKAAGILTVTINKSTTAKIGELVIGTKKYLGATQANPSPEIEIVDYSSQAQDTFGNWTIVERGYSKKLNCDVKIPKTSVLTARQVTDDIFLTLSSYRASMIVWVADSTMSSMIIYGKYNSFKITLTSIEFSLLNLEILGMI